MTCFLPSNWLVSGLRYSQVQCLVMCTCLAASVWQDRQTLVTSGPELKVCCNSLNLLWSAVDFSSFGLGFGFSGALLAWAGAISARAAMVASVYLMKFISLPLPDRRPAPLVSTKDTILTLY